ncbi:MAG: Rne/Rng family ribonuclease [candidate division WOR-3 bacterium]|nr:Rne/Rng family ribonuclease [candidate division WOR-3 bacterium]
MIKKDIFVSVATTETRIAVLENDTLIEFHVDRPDQISLVGNIYKARVLNLMTGLKAAFVDIGMEKNGFLPLDEIPFKEFSEMFENEDIEIEEEFKTEGVKLKENQEIIIQITKDSYGVKGPRVTSYISIPGRYVVLLLNAKNIGVSRKIHHRHEREQLARLAREIRPPGMGLIIRTAAATARPEEIQREVQYLKSMWEKSLKLAETEPAPCLIYAEPSPLIKIVRDLFNQEVRNLYVDDETRYREIIDYLNNVSPRMRSRVKLYRDPEPLFFKFGIEEQLKTIFERKVWLPSGGYIVLDHTEAFLAIDVNTGKSSKERQAEKLALSTNLEAIREIARQLRLRDIGGLVVVDLIDMEKKENIDRVVREFKSLIRNDRARYKIGEVSEFGLFQFTRERSRTSLTYSLSEVCPVCKGRGRVISKMSVISDIERWFFNNARSIKNKIVELQVSPRIADFLTTRGSDILAKFSKDSNLILKIKPDYTMAEDDFKVSVV